MEDEDYFVVPTALMPVNDNVSLSKNVKIVATNSFCRGCKTMARKYIDRTPGEILGKYLCNCVDDNNEATGPVFPLFEAKVLKTK